MLVVPNDTCIFKLPNTFVSHICVEFFYFVYAVILMKGHLEVRKFRMGD
jgi:hypothetical protein